MACPLSMKDEMVKDGWPKRSNLFHEPHSNTHKFTSLLALSLLFYFVRPLSTILLYNYDD